MSKAVCDNCNKEFKIKIRTQKIKDDIERVYFACPKCKTSYECYYTNDKIKALQRQIKALQNKYNGLRGRKLGESYIVLQEITKIKSKIGKEMDLLKNIYR